MQEYAEFCKSKGIYTIAFGDIFLEDLRKYREDKMAEADMKCIFPLWKIPTRDVINEFLALGYQTKICAGDAAKIDKSMIGETITQVLLSNLGQAVDPCGENGEFHTFVYGGPLFENSIQINLKSVHSHFYEYQIEENGKIKKMKSEFFFAEFD
jgi:diphthamide synthase (EF-2-diphthine--ammonia ligase)